MKIKNIIIAIFVVSSIFSIATISAVDIDNNLTSIENSNINNSLTSYEDINTQDKENVNLSSSNIEMYYQDGTRFYATLTNINNTPLANQTLYFTINNLTYNKTTDENGTASIGLNLNPNVYDGQVYFNGDSVYKNATTLVTIKINSLIESSDLTKYYKNDSQYYATFLDNQGNPLTNTNVTFNINGVMYTRQTNQNGTAKLTINLNSGEYILTSIHPNGYQKGNLIKVLPVTIGENLTKYYKNDSQYYATFLDNQGNPLTNTNVTFNINGVIYTRQTNQNGTAKLTINLNSGEYILTSIHPNGYQTSNIVKVLSVIESEDLIKGYKDSSKFTAVFLDGQGKPLKNKEVTFNINGVFYKRTTDNKGVGTLNINLEANDYIITTIHPDNNYATSNVVSVRDNYSTYFTVDSNNELIENEDTELIFTLYNKLHNSLKDKKVIATINDVTYELTTNESGKVSIPVNLKAGTYNSNIKFEGDEHYQNTSTDFVITVEPGTGVILIPLNSSEMFYGEDFEIKVSDKNNTLLNNTPVVFKIENNEINTQTDDKGIAKLNLSYEEGVYEITYYVNKTGYSKKTNTSQIKLFSTHETEISNFTDIVVKGNAFEIYLYSNYLPLENRNISITINGRDYIRQTDTNGIARITINLNEGNYLCNYTFNGDNKFNPSSNSTNIIVKDKINTNIESITELNYVEGNENYFKVLLIDDAGYPVENATVIFTLEGNNYEVLTSMGIASLPLLLSKGTYQISYRFNGNDKLKPCENTDTINIIEADGSVSIKSIIGAASEIIYYLNEKGTIPETVNINNVEYSCPVLLYLLTTATVQIANENFENIEIINVDSPESPLTSTISGNLSLEQYLDIASRTSSFIIKYEQAPNYASSDLGKIPYSELIELYADVLNNYNENNKLPDTIALYINPISEVFDNIWAECSGWTYGSGSSMASLIATGHGTCWAWSEYLFTRLKEAGVSARIVQYATAYSSNHRSVQYIGADGEWTAFPYREYGYPYLVRDTSAQWYGTVIDEYIAE